MNKSHEITGAVIKSLGENTLKKINQLMNEIYQSGENPLDFTRAVVVPIPKKA